MGYRIRIIIESEDEVLYDSSDTARVIEDVCEILHSTALSIRGGYTPLPTFTEEE